MPDLVCICETWLNDTVLSSELLPGYSIFRRDRACKTGGGVPIAVKSDLQSIRHNDLERNATEMVVVEIFTCSKSLLLYTFYRPPGSNNVDLNHLNSSLRSNSESRCVLVVGDFNIPASLDWTDSSSPVNIGGNVIGDNFFNLMGDNFLFQLVHCPTHIAGNKLDLVLCNCPEVIDGVSTHSLGVTQFPSDHYIIDFSVRVKFHRANPVRRKVYDFKRGKFAELRSSLEHVPFDVAFSENIDEYWLASKDLFLTTVSEFIPIKTVKDTNSPHWMDSEDRHYLRKKYTGVGELQPTS